MTVATDHPQGATTTLQGIVNGTNADLDWQGLPPQFLFQDANSNELSFVPSPEQDFLSTPISPTTTTLSLSCTFKLRAAAKDDPNRCESIECAGGLKIRSSAGHEASIGFAYVDARPCLKTSVKRGEEAPDESFHEWPESKEEAATSSAKASGSSAGGASGLAFVATTNERKNDLEPSVRKLLSSLSAPPLSSLSAPPPGPPLPPPPPSKKNKKIWSVVQGTLRLAWSRDGGVSFEAGDVEGATLKKLRACPSFMSESVPAPRSKSSPTSINDSLQSVSLTSMQPTSFCVKKSSDGKGFIMARKQPSEVPEDGSARVQRPKPENGESGESGEEIGFGGIYAQSSVNGDRDVEVTFSFFQMVR